MTVEIGQDTKIVSGICCFFFIVVSQSYMGIYKVEQKYPCLEENAF